MDQWRQISRKGLPLRTRALLILLVRSMQAHDFPDGKKKNALLRASFRTRPWTHRKQLGGPGEVGDRVPSSGVGPVLYGTRSRLRVAGTKPARRCRDESEGPHGDVVRLWAGCESVVFRRSLRCRAQKKGVLGFRVDKKGGGTLRVNKQIILFKFTQNDVRETAPCTIMNRAIPFTVNHRPAKWQQLIDLQ